MTDRGFREPPLDIVLHDFPQAQHRDPGVLLDEDSQLGHLFPAEMSIGVGSGPLIGIQKGPL
jgi:hypothetical protein